MRHIKLKKLDGLYTISQLPPSSPLPAWSDGPGFVSISRCDDELSVVCLKERVPEDVKSDGEWSCFKFLGPFAFDEAGIVLSVVRPISENGIGVFVVSTFNGDYLLIQNGDVDAASLHLAAEGHMLL